MYFGDSPVKVDMETAKYILRQKDSMPEGAAWNGQFPPIVNHTSSAVARHHPDFKAAKHGDFQAALRLVDELVKDEKIALIASRFPKAHIIYNHRMQGDGINMIPAAYAARFSAIGMTVEHNIVAVTNVSHTNASDISRISKRMRFDGHVNKGVDYILLDDFVTSGAELRDLRDYVSSQGGNVVAMTTFGHGSFGKLKDIRIDEAYRQKLQDAGVTDIDLRKYGIASEIGCLTLGEAAKLARMVVARAKGKASQVFARMQRISDSCWNAQALAGEVPGDKVKGKLINKELNENEKAVRKGLHR